MTEQHGASKYTNDNCRCVECRTAWAEYIQNRKSARKRYVDQNGLPTSVQHGESAYGNWGCRCEVCRTDHNLRARLKYRRLQYSG